MLEKGVTIPAAYHSKVERHFQSVSDFRHCATIADVLCLMHHVAVLQS